MIRSITVFHVGQVLIFNLLWSLNQLLNSQSILLAIKPLGRGHYRRLLLVSLAFGVGLVVLVGGFEAVGTHILRFEGWGEKITFDA